MTSYYQAKFSNGLTIVYKDNRRVMTHAWHATGYHRLSNKPWSLHGFSGTHWQAQQRLEMMTRFAVPDRIGFEEIVGVELIGIGRQLRSDVLASAAHSAAE